MSYSSRDQQCPLLQPAATFRPNMIFAGGVLPGGASETRTRDPLLAKVVQLTWPSAATWPTSVGGSPGVTADDRHPPVDRARSGHGRARPLPYQLWPGIGGRGPAPVRVGDTQAWRTSG